MIRTSEKPLGVRGARKQGPFESPGLNPSYPPRRTRRLASPPPPLDWQVLLRKPRESRSGSGGPDGRRRAEGEVAAAATATSPEREPSCAGMTAYSPPVPGPEPRTSSSTRASTNKRPHRHLARRLGDTFVRVLRTAAAKSGCRNTSTTRVRSPKGVGLTHGAQGGGGCGPSPPARLYYYCWTVREGRRCYAADPATASEGGDPHEIERAGTPPRRSPRSSPPRSWSATSRPGGLDIRYDLMARERRAAPAIWDRAFAL